MNELALTGGIVAAALAIGALVLRRIARSNTRLSSIVAITLLCLGVATSPIWASVIFVLVGGVLTTSQNYWAAAPWYVIIAVYSYTRYSIAVAGLMLVLYVATQGNVWFKLKRCFISLPVIAGGAALLFSVLSHRAAEARATREANERAVIHFAETSAELTAGVPGRPNASATAIGQPGEPERYLLAMRGSGDIRILKQAMISVVRTADGAQFSIACIAPRMESLDGWYKPGFTCGPQAQ